LATKPPSIIGLYSPAPQMGKSTVSRFLTEGLGYTLVKFAGPVKAVAAVFLTEMGVPEDMLHDYIEGHLKEEALGAYGFDSLTSRRIQQVMGTEAGRKALDANLWTTIAGRKIRKIVDAGGRVIIDDMRFPNEYDLIKAMGGECWCVFNPRVDIPVTSHPSEGLLANHAFDQAMINEGTIEDLQVQVSGAVTRF
jgi:hypothetical protein